MAKVLVSNELIDLIRSIRIDKKKTAKEISQVLKKSDSYVAKLESGKIKFLNMDDLVTIFTLLSDGDSNIEPVLEVAYNRLKIKYSPSEIENQLWFYNFDTIGRVIPVPESFRHEINQTLNTINMSIETLVSHINANEFIPQEIANNKDFPFNEWFSATHADGTSDVYIKMRKETQDIQGILDGKIIAAPYTTFLAVALYTLCYSRENCNPPTENEMNQLNIDAHAMLRKHRIYKFIEKQEIRESVSEEQKTDLLSPDDLEVIRELNEIKQLFYLYSDLDVTRAKKQLHEIKNNLKWDAPFITSLMSTEFSSLGEHCSYTFKSELIKELRAVFKKYLEAPENQRKMETYSD